MKSPYIQIAEERGFTLVEIMIVMALVAIFMGGLMAMFVGFSKSYTTENVKADVQQVVRGGVEHMVPYIRMAGFEPLTLGEPAQTTTDNYAADNDGYGAGFKFAATQKIRFTMDLDQNATIEKDPLGGPNDPDERITYEYFPNEDGGTLKRIVYEGGVDQDARTQPIVSNVRDFSFTYFDVDNNPLNAGIGNFTSLSDNDCDLIRTVVIRMTVREPAGRDGFIRRTYETRVRARNLKD